MEELIQALKREVDETLLAENLKLTHEERVREMIAVLGAVEEFERAGRILRGEP